MKNLKKFAFILSLVFVLVTGTISIYPMEDPKQTENSSILQKCKTGLSKTAKQFTKTTKQLAKIIYDYKISIATILSSRSLYKLEKILEQVNPELSKAARSTKHGLLLLLTSIAIFETSNRASNEKRGGEFKIIPSNQELIAFFIIPTLPAALAGLALIFKENGLPKLLEHTPELLRYPKINYEIMFILKNLRACLKFFK